MRRRKIVFILVSMALGCISAPARAAVISLKDGSQIRGTVISATARDIQVHTDNGVLKIDTDRISQIDYSGAVTAPAQSLPDARPMPGSPIQNQSYETGPENQVFSFDLGLLVPVSEVDFTSIGGGKADNGDLGILLGTQYLYERSSKLGLGLNLEFFNRGSNDTSSLLPAADTSVSGNSLVLMGIARYRFIERGHVRPYFLVGVGGNRTSTKIDAAPRAGFVWSDTSTDETRRIISESNWGLAATGRLGLEFMLAEPTTFSMELGWMGLWNDRFDATQDGRDLGVTSVTGNIQGLTISGKWAWRF